MSDAILPLALPLSVLELGLWGNQTHKSPITSPSRMHSEPLEGADLVCGRGVGQDLEQQGKAFQAEGKE